MAFVAYCQFDKGLKFTVVICQMIVALPLCNRNICVYDPQISFYGKTQLCFTLDLTYLKYIHVYFSLFSQTSEFQTDIKLDFYVLQR